MPRLRWWLLIVSLVSFARGAEHVTFYPDWFAGPQFAGIYVAIDRGLFAEAGLEVTISPFAFGKKVPELIDAAPADCGVGAIEGYIFLQQRAAGKPLQALAAMLQESPAGFMAIEPVRLASARDFAGRRVGVHKFADPLFRWFVAQAGLAPERVTMSFTDGDFTRMTRGELDVMQGYATEEFVRLQQAVGERAHFLPFSALGFSSYGEVLFTTAQAMRAESHRETLRRFASAVRRGWLLALAEPRIGIAATQQRLEKTADESYLAASFAALKPYVSPGDQPPLALMSVEKWRRLQAVAIEIGLIKRAEAPEDFLIMK